MNGGDWVRGLGACALLAGLWAGVVTEPVEMFWFMTTGSEKAIGLAGTGLVILGGIGNGFLFIAWRKQRRMPS